MKILFAISTILLSSPALASGVSVIVDGETYTCSKGGSAGVFCQCRRTTPSAARV
jgi:hypothetical protein